MLVPQLSDKHTLCIGKLRYAVETVKVCFVCSPNDRNHFCERLLVYKQWHKVNSSRQQIGGQT